MMSYVLLIAATVSLVLLYKFLPTKKIFMLICTIFLVVFSASALIHGRQVQHEQVTRAQLEERLEQQKIFGEWYADYQKDIDRLDRNWQLYHNILVGLQSVEPENFNAEALWFRLKELEQDSIEEQLKMHMLAAPHGLKTNDRRLVEEIIRKTQHYVDAQTLTISRSTAETNPDAPKDLETLRARLQDIMIRESPEGLFIAQEVSAIRAALQD